MRRLDADWSVLSPLLDEALALSGDARGDWLRRLAATDPALATTIESLLSEQAQVEAEVFLGESAPVPLAGLQTFTPAGKGAIVMTRNPCVLNLVVLLWSLTAAGEVRAEAPSAAGHEHLGEVACVDVPAGEKRPEFGCFNVGTVRDLKFRQARVYWHLYAFPDTTAAGAARSATGIVVEEDGRVWLSEFGARDAAPHSGESVAVVGPLELSAAASYNAVLSYAVMRPGDSSRVHTHPGPEAWYVLTGDQCLETPAGASNAGAGQTMTVPANVPMELTVTGTTLRRAFALVIHDSAQDRGTPSDWTPPGKCSR